MQTRKRGKSGTRIPVSSLSSMLLASVRAYAALAKWINRRPNLGKYKDHYMAQTEVSREVLEHLQRDLDGVCRPEDMQAVADAIHRLCAHSVWANEPIDK